MERIEALQVRPDVFIRELKDLDYKWNGLSSGILPLIHGEGDREGPIRVLKPSLTAVPTQAKCLHDDLRLAHTRLSRLQAGPGAYLPLWTEDLGMEAALPRPADSVTEPPPWRGIGAPGSDTRGRKHLFWDSLPTREYGKTA